MSLTNLINSEVLPTAVSPTTVTFRSLPMVNRLKKTWRSTRVLIHKKSPSSHIQETIGTNDILLTVNMNDGTQTCSKPHA